MTEAGCPAQVPCALSGAMAVTHAARHCTRRRQTTEPGTITTYNQSPAEYAFMKPFGTAILILLITLILATGCTQSQSTPQPVTAAPTQSPTTTALPAGTSVPGVTVSAPQVTVTIIHFIVPTKAWKDSVLHIAFAAPQDWTVTTMPVKLPEGSQGLIYQTNLDPAGAFNITTFPVSLSNDQAYRDTFRTWDPAPVQTTITINGIVFDRFESAKDGKTQVGYVAQKASANDIGFSSVLKYTTDASRPFDREDFEKVVGSFSYFTSENASTMPGGEIPRIRYSG
jgi:hypothetical protein